MCQDELARRCQLRDAHRFRKFQMLLDGLVSPERAFKDQEIGVARERCQLLIVSGVRSVNERLAVVVRHSKREAFLAVRRRYALRAEAGQQFKLVRFADC